MATVLFIIIAEKSILANLKITKNMEKVNSSATAMKLLTSGCGNTTRNMGRVNFRLTIKSQKGFGKKIKWLNNSE